jgi:hypothetical protein
MHLYYCDCAGNPSLGSLHAAGVSFVSSYCIHCKDSKYFSLRQPQFECASSALHLVLAVFYKRYIFLKMLYTVALCPLI